MPEDAPLEQFSTAEGRRRQLLVDLFQGHLRLLLRMRNTAVRGVAFVQRWAPRLQPLQQFLAVSSCC